MITRTTSLAHPLLSFTYLLATSITTPRHAVRIRLSDDSGNSIENDDVDKDEGPWSTFTSTLHKHHKNNLASNSKVRCYRDVLSRFAIYDLNPFFQSHANGSIPRFFGPSIRWFGSPRVGWSYVYFNLSTCLGV